MLPISVCIIAKNEAACIARCLESLAPFGFELIVLDTGSTDETKEIALGYTKHVYDFTWVDDFSAARNASITYASHDFIFIVDCDDILESIDLSALDLYMTHHSNSMGSITYKSEIKDPSGGLTYDFCPVTRLFNKQFYHYEGMIHEQVMPLTTKSSLTELPITLLHTGYNGSYDDECKKASRNIALLEKALLTQTTSSYYYFQLGRDLVTMKDYARARDCFQKAVIYNDQPDLIYTKMLYVNYASLLRNEGCLEDAITLLESASSIIGDYADATYLLATLYYDTKNALNAILHYIKALSCSTYSNHAYKTYLAHYALGLIYEQLGNSEMAISFYKNCLHYKDTNERMNRLT